MEEIKQNDESNCASSRQKECKAKEKCQVKYDYDLIVIGGGPGGLATAKEAALFGAKIALFDFVTPTPHGTKWGIGGTCSNVGCVPKKMSHHAALLGEAVNDSRQYGWQPGDNISHKWEEMRTEIQNHIKSLSWLIKIELSERNIEYIKGMGSFKDPHTITAVKSGGQEEIMTGKYILIAVGSRPIYPDIPGAKEYGITSDDLFSLHDPPGKTLIVGAGYIGLECSGFLRGLGYEVTLMNRTSVALRRCDQQMAGLVVSELKHRGVKFLNNSITTSVDKSPCTGKLRVSWKNDKNEQFSEHFDTVMFALGRKAATKYLNLENAGVEVAKDGAKIDTVNEQTNIPHIFAVGDVLYGKPELTPTAIQAGMRLARRLFGGSKVTMDYDLIATTIFTPIEYGAAGMSEETAIKRYGEDEIEVYHSYYKPIEFLVPERSTANCYLKVIALREGDRKVLGMHFMGPNAGEVIQGYLAAMKCGLTMDTLLDTVGLDADTNSAEFTRLTITKRSGEDPNPQP